MSILVGICGGTGSGKSTLATRVRHQLEDLRGPSAATVLSFDGYYHDQSAVPLEERKQTNYDHPDALDHGLLVEHLVQLRAGNAIAVPVYDFNIYSRSDDIQIVDAAEVVLVEGILLFAYEAVRDLLDLTVFRRCPEDVRFSRRIKRDIAERGRSLDSVEAQLTATVKPMHDQYVEPFADTADLIVDHSEELADITDRVANSVFALIATGS